MREIEREIVVEHDPVERERERRYNMNKKYSYICVEIEKKKKIVQVFLTWLNKILAKYSFVHSFSLNHVSLPNAIYYSTK